MACITVIPLLLPWPCLIAKQWWAKPQLSWQAECIAGVLPENPPKEQRKTLSCSCCCAGQSLTCMKQDKEEHHALWSTSPWLWRLSIAFWPFFPKWRRSAGLGFWLPVGLMAVEGYYWVRMKWEGWAQLRTTVRHICWFICEVADRVMTFLKPRASALL